MDNQLKTLIALCEEEKINLERLIKECVAEAEYMLAHYHWRAFVRLNGRLQTLHNIDDHLYDKKKSKLQTINYLEKQIEHPDLTHRKAYFTEELVQAKQMLEKLNNTPPQPANEENNSLLRNVLTRLIDRKVKNVKLILKKQNNLFLAFSYANRTMKVVIPNLNQHLKNRTLYDSEISKFEKLGFKKTGNGSKIILTIAGDKQEVIRNLEIVLSKIVFEIFYYKEFKNESFIQFTEKSDH